MIPYALAGSTKAIPENMDEAMAAILGLSVRSALAAFVEHSAASEVDARTRVLAILNAEGGKLTALQVRAGCSVAGLHARADDALWRGAKAVSPPRQS